MKRRDDLPFELSADDQRVLDALVEAGFDSRTLADSDRPRGEQVADLFSLLEDYPIEDGTDTLVHATLAGIDRHEADRSARYSFDGAQEERRVRGVRRWRFPDFISVAAVLLIGAAIFWPALSTIRQRSLESQCANNLRQVGYAFGQYASSHNGALPVAKAGVGQTWDAVANVINLGPLTKGGFCERGHLSCPGVHASEAVDSSYSYQCQAPGVRVQWDNSKTLVLGDRNPLVDAYRAGRPAGPMTMSTNHRGRGQNVLGSDGQTIWLEAPIIGANDNIWLPEGKESLEPGGWPASASDVFLAH